VIAGVILAVYLLKRAWETNFGGIRDTVLGAWDKIRLAFEGIKALIGSLSGGVGQMSAELAEKLKAAGLLGFVVTVFKVYYRVREALAIVVRAFVWMGKVTVGALVNTAKFIYKFLLSVRLIVAAFVAAGKIIYAVWQVLTGDISLLDGLKAIGGAVFDFLATSFRWARDVVAGVWDFISGVFTSIGRLVTDVAAMIGNAFLNLPIISTLRDLFATVRSFLAGDTTFFEAGKKLQITLGKGILSAAAYPFTMLKNALGKLRTLLPFSDAKQGPLSNLTASGAALLKTLAEGIGKAKTLPVEQISESLLNLVPRLDGRLLPKAMSAMLMLQPVMAQALPSQLPMPGIMQLRNTEPGMQNEEHGPTPHALFRSPHSSGPNAASAGAAESGQDLRGLLSAVLSRLDALADRPVELNVTTTIDGRKVAEAVYKDLRERKIRNYETL
jgi:hypothetical protein